MNHSAEHDLRSATLLFYNNFAGTSQWVQEHLARVFNLDIPHKYRCDQLTHT